MATKKEIKDALKEARETGRPQRVGRWTLTASRVRSPGIGYAWHWFYYAQPDELGCALGGCRSLDEAADIVLRSDARGETFSTYPAHSRR